MTKTLKAQISKLSISQLLEVRAGLELLHSHVGGVLNIGTGCSGTDIWVGCWQGLVEMWNRQFGIKFELRHRVAAENVDFKAEWIQAHWAPDVLLADLSEMSQPMAHDWHGQQVPVPAVAFWSCGIECDSISGLSQQASSNRDCIQAATGRTGTTAQWHFDYVRVSRPVFWQIENVRNLCAKDKETGLSNLDVLVAKSNELGYFVWSKIMEANKYGVRQSRGRLYAVGFLISSQPINQKAETFVQPTWVSKFNVVVETMQIPPLPWSAFLLSDDGLRGPGGSVTPPAKRPRKGVAKPQTVMNFEVEHLNIYTSFNITWPPDFTPEFAQKTRSLSRRMAEVLWFQEAVEGQASALTHVRVRDLNMSINWGTESRDECPCIVSTSLMWARGTYKNADNHLTTIDRALSGEEVLALQGFGHDLQRLADETQCWSSKQKYDLAGNAFAGPISHVLIIAWICCAPLDLSFASVRLPVVVAADVKNDLDEDEEDGEHAESELLSSEEEEIGCNSQSSG